MTRVAKFLRAPGSNKRLLVKSTMLLFVVRVSLWILPFPVVQQILSKRTRSLPVGPADPASVARVAWAIGVGRRYTPNATCLTQALATEILLRSIGQQASLLIGVARSAGGDFEAHAWVESNGGVVVGMTTDLSRYVVLSSRNGRSL